MRLLFAILITWTCSVVAAVQSLPFNTSSTFTPQPNDILRLTSLPAGWDYSAVAVRVDPVEGAPLSLKLQTPKGVENLTGWGSTFRFCWPGAPADAMKIVSTDSKPIQVTWWLEQNEGCKTSSSSTSSSSHIASSSSTSSSSSQPHSSSSTASSDWTAGTHIIDLGANNATAHYNGMSQEYAISEFPDWNFNIVSVLVEPRDGRELTGSVMLGLKRAPLKGWSHKVQIQYRPGLPIRFDVVTPDRRSLQITWWAEIRQPESAAIEQQSEIKAGKLEVTYAFSPSHIVETDLKITFTPSDFLDGNPPSITRYAHRPPQIPEVPANYQRGPLYEINGHLAAGKRVVMALPLPERAVMEGYNSSEVRILHLESSIGQWVEIAPDSIVNGYAYFMADGFSIWSWAKKTFSTVWDATWGYFPYNIDFLNGLIDGMIGAYKSITEGICSLLNFKRNFTQLGIYMGLAEKKQDWSPPTGSLGGLHLPQQRAAIPPDWIRQLKEFRNRPLESLDQANHPDVAKLDLLRWEISSRNVETLLADRIIAELEGTPRRFRITEGGKEIVHWALGFALVEDAGGVPGQQEPTTIPLLKILKTQSDLFEVIPLIYACVRAFDEALGFQDEIEQTGTHLANFYSSYLNEGLAQGNFEPSCNEMFETLPDLFDVGAIDASVKCLYLKEYNSKHSMGSYIYVKDEILLTASKTLNHLVALLFLDKEMRSILAPQAQSLSDHLVATFGIIKGFYGGNNIVIKGLAGPAVWQYLYQGKTDRLDLLNSQLENYLGAAGSSPEGSGYLQYINDDVLYLLAAITNKNKITAPYPAANISPKYRRVGSWLANTSRPVAQSLIPVEIDDGVTRPTDYLPWSHWDKNLLGSALAYPSPTMGTPLAFLTIPAMSLQQVAATEPLFNHAQPIQVMEEGVALLRAVIVDPQTGLLDTISISMIAEHGDAWSKGLAHDQQDQLSVTLTSARKGWILRDRGYSGFTPHLKRYGNFEAFSDHNVCLDPAHEDGGEARNGRMVLKDGMRMATDLGFYHLNRLDETLVDIIMSLAMAPEWASPLVVSGWIKYKEMDILDGYNVGGAPAHFAGQLLPMEAHPNTYGVSASHTSTSGVTNNRTLLRHEDYFFVIDRPDQQKQMAVQWNTVSPINELLGNKQLVLGDVDTASALFHPVASIWTDLLQEGYSPDGILQNGGVDTLVKVFENRWPSPSTLGRAPVLITPYRLGNDQIGSAGDWRDEPCGPKARCLSRTLRSGGRELLMATSADQGMVPIPAPFTPGQKRQLRGVALVHADGYIDFIGELDQVQKPDRLVVEGEYLVGYDLNGNEIFRQLIRSTRQNALTHLPLLLGD